MRLALSSFQLQQRRAIVYESFINWSISGNIIIPPTKPFYQEIGTKIGANA